VFKNTLGNARSVKSGSQIELPLLRHNDGQSTSRIHYINDSES